MVGRKITLTVLVTVDTGKHHLIGVGELLPHYVRCLLKNRMKHLTEPAPVGGKWGWERIFFLIQALSCAVHL